MLWHWWLRKDVVTIWHGDVSQPRWWCSGKFFSVYKMLIGIHREEQGAHQRNASNGELLHIVVIQRMWNHQVSQCRTIFALYMSSPLYGRLITCPLRVLHTVKWQIDTFRSTVLKQSQSSLLLNTSAIHLQNDCKQMLSKLKVMYSCNMHSIF